MGVRVLACSYTPHLWVDKASEGKLSTLYSQFNFASFRASAAGKIENFITFADRGRLSQQRFSNVSEIGEPNYLSNYRTALDAAATMLRCASEGDIRRAQMIWDELVNSSFQPDLEMVCGLISELAKRGYYTEVVEVLSQLKYRGFGWLRQVYSHAVCCLGMGGELEMMEMTIKEMASMGFTVDSVTGNAYVLYYAMFGTLQDAQNAYGRLKKSMILIEREAILAVSVAFIKNKKYYDLGKFLKGMGLGRRNVGNLLWNLLLLSYAVNFKMKSLQRTFVAMVESGFEPDLTTFNIRALVFSRMDLFWDLHLSLEHMRHANIVPDLVTYGCVVDAYLDKRMGKNLDFAMQRMVNQDDAPVVVTEPYVFEAMGKGDFHMSSEAFMEFSSKRSKGWTYSKLIGLYLKKQHRSNQIFWNY